MPVARRRDQRRWPGRTGGGSADLEVSTDACCSGGRSLPRTGGPPSALIERRIKQVPTSRSALQFPCGPTALRRAFL